MIRARIISSLDKCFPDTNIEALTPLHSVSALRGETLSFQLACGGDDNKAPHRLWCRPLLGGVPAEFCTVRLVDFIPSLMPVYPDPKYSDDNYISKEPGLYPDLLSELPMGGCFPLCGFQTRCLWLTAELPSDMAAGSYELTVELLCGEETVVSESLTVNVIPAALPEQRIKVTQWFHCDCLADFYRVPVFSERHWEIIENFACTAVKNGINTLLTPLFTPPLDTAVGHERPTVQLVGVTRRGGEYSFDYSLLDRWIAMCDRVGIKYFEINHFFTQWGAAHAPKVMADDEGDYRRIFGWETDAAEGEYPRFLHRFIPDFIAHMKARGDDRRCIFHVSDEPNPKNIEQYTRSRGVVAGLLEGYTTMDALSHIDFWRTGAVETPVVSNSSIQPFIDANVPHLWTYYCCGQGVGTSNRFFAMPGARTRVIGMQLYKYKIEGFLQWGYNFYYNQGSFDLVNPYLDSTGGYFFPSGDGYSVYPSDDGHALESMRIVQFREALCDLAAMELCESLVGRDAVLAALESVAGEIRFDKSSASSAVVLAAREKINGMIAAAL